MNPRIGFMQGRLSPLVNGRIQAFPWDHWKDEFPAAAQTGFLLMEWTLDQERLYENPLLTAKGRAEIRQLCDRYRLQIPSLTGDCFMQAPFWKVAGQARHNLQAEFIAVCRACGDVGIEMVVVPLVDNGRLDNPYQEDVLVGFLNEHALFFGAAKLKIVFESDFQPLELARFIARLDPETFGINYDIGNSAALGFAPDEEFAAYGARVNNVHVKDRVLGGTTVPLGQGNADLDCVFARLAQLRYAGNLILQTARASDENHAMVLVDYARKVTDLVEKHRVDAA